MHERVFAPMGMDHTLPDQVSEIIPGRGRYYELTEQGVENSPAVDNSYKWAGGGFLSTSEDLVRFGFGYLSGDVLEPETIREMWTTQATASGETTGYGIGWGVGTDDSGNPWVGHTGGSVGGTTFFRIYPDRELIVAVIANVSSGSFGDFPVQIASIFMDE
jgi:CubicO group peptidase (beta-lactamase class C family)